MRQSKKKGEKKQKPDKEHACSGLSGSGECGRAGCTQSQLEPSGALVPSLTRRGSATDVAEVEVEAEGSFVDLPCEAGATSALPSSSNMRNTVEKGEDTSFAGTLLPVALDVEAGGALFECSGTGAVADLRSAALPDWLPGALSPKEKKLTKASAPDGDS